MGNVPLHPLVVHLPLVLAMVLPIVVASLLWREWRGRPPNGAWWLATLLAAVLTVSAFVSVRTGETEEELVEDVVPHQALELHEERGELFLWATLAPLVILIGVSLTPRPKWRRYGGYGALVATLLVAGQAFLVGESGGSLVYEHNAGAAYGPSDAVAPQAESSPEEDDDDD